MDSLLECMSIGPVNVKEATIKSDNHFKKGIMG